MTNSFIFANLLSFIPADVLEKTEFMRELIVILIAIKIAGHISKKFGQPSVFGKLLIGVILGPSLLGWLHTSNMLKELAEVGVILLMFLAGLETDLDEFKKSAKASTFAAVGGVLLPFIGGFILAEFYGFDFHHSLFIGVVFVATSVSISVQTLRELGKLQTPEGFTILGAAVIDDILGLIALSVVLGIALGSGTGAAGIAILLVKVVLFFIFGIAVGIYVLPKVLEFGEKVLVTEGVLTFAIIIGLFYAVAAEVFGLAGIVGAYLAGIMISLTRFQHLLFEKVETVGYSFFIPLFFISIGVAADASGLTGNVLMFTLIALLIAVLGKVVGSGAGAMLAGFNLKSSLGIGSGMVSRGEVALIIANIGLTSGLIGTELFTSMVVVTIVTTVVTPPLLKAIFKD